MQHSTVFTVQYRHRIASERWASRRAASLLSQLIRKCVGRDLCILIVARLIASELINRRAGGLFVSFINSHEPSSPRVGHWNVCSALLHFAEAHRTHARTLCSTVHRAVGAPLRSEATLPLKLLVESASASRRMQQPGDERPLAYYKYRRCERSGRARDRRADRRRRGVHTGLPLMSYEVAPSAPSARVECAPVGERRAAARTRDARARRPAALECCNTVLN